ncbi:MAG: ABC-2 family transporter protein [Spirochaetales bacterium]|nr:ABC-2 family transporter protein [Spirochaetales bacterium]
MKLVRVLFRYFRFNLAAAMEYRVAFFTQVIGMFLNNTAFLFFWFFLFEKIGSAINGYGFNDILFLWSLTATGFGLADLLAGNSHNISRIIYSGELDVFILQPKPVLLNMLWSKMNISGLGDLLYGLALFFITQTLNPLTIFLFIFFSVIAMVIFVSVRVFYHSLTFFLGNSETFAQTVSEATIAFTLYPGTIFKGPVVWILHSLIPAALLAFLPLSLVRSFDPLLFLLVVAGDCIIVLVSVFTFSFGLRFYESGNKMGTRL